MKTIDLSKLSEEEALKFTQVLDTIAGQEDKVHIEREGKLLYSLSRPSPSKSVNEFGGNQLIDDSLSPKDLLQKKEDYTMQTDETVGDFLSRMLSHGPMLEEEFEGMTPEEVQYKLWEGRGYKNAE